MRVTAETRAATRQRILEAARQLFTENGSESATTRDIAQKAEIGVGTLFNYFPTREAVLATLAAEALETAQKEFSGQGSDADSLEEELFAYVATGLRRLKPLRRQLPLVLETALSPLSPAGNGDSQALRVMQLETVRELSRKRGILDLSPVALQLYWSLYIGLLLFWASDKSPRQEDTLALLDHSIEMFVGWLKSQPDR